MNSGIANIELTLIKTRFIFSIFFSCSGYEFFLFRRSKISNFCLSLGPDVLAFLQTDICLSMFQLNFSTSSFMCFQLFSNFFLTFTLILRFRSLVCCF